MSKGGSVLRRQNHNLDHQKDKGFVLPTQPEEEPPADSSPAQPASASSLRRHVAASLIQHYRSTERNGHAPVPLSPASYGSSMEVAPYNHAATPSSSLDFKSRFGEASYTLKTSTELLKILNRIWSLEEQHASSISLVKALKKELEHSQTRVKELLRERKRDRQEMDVLMKQMAEDNFSRKNKEQDRIKAALQSVRNELEDERKLRKHSESLHRKLSREIFEVKSSFSNALKELERERKARILLEDLCDEFAKGIRDYEQEVRFLKHKPVKDQLVMEHSDCLILHISEAWIDERMQTKPTEAQGDLAEKNTIVDKLRSEIECFLLAKQSARSGNNGDVCLEKPDQGRFPRQSLESFQIHEAASAPRHGNDEDDSTTGALHCCEINRRSRGKQNNSISKDEENAQKCHFEEKIQSNPVKKAQESEVSKCCDPSSLQTQHEGHMSEHIPRNGSTTNLMEVGLEKPAEEMKKNSKRSGSRDKNSKHGLENLTQNHSSLLEVGKLCQESNYLIDSFDHSEFTGLASPVKKWVSRLTTPGPQVSESSSKRSLGRGFKENTLKAKLLEARLESQQLRSKAPKASLQDG